MNRSDRSRRARWFRRLRRVAFVLAALFAGWLLLCSAVLLTYRWVDPPVTGVQLQRRIEAIGSPRGYTRQYRPVPLERISPHLAHAVVAAEDTRFYQHRGVDWEAIREALDDKGRRRGGSGLSQQLAKNLFLTTHSTWARKAVEFPLTYLTEWILGKRRILELYLNVAEWGPGVFGAEAAARHHYGIPASALTREQAARLAACLPAPRRRVPQAMDRYSAVIEKRMAQLGW